MVLKVVPIQVELSDLKVMAEFAAQLAQVLPNSGVIFLHGNLGAGKTTLVRNILAALNYTGITKSPTFTLVETYTLKDLVINHFDLYRIADPSELEFMGIRDYLSGQALCIFEWPQKGAGILPPADLEITLEYKGMGRIATVTANSPVGQQIIDKLLVKI